MLDELKQFQRELGYCFEVYDIDDDEKLLEQFNALVPIVFLGDQEIFRYYFEYATLIQALKWQSDRIGSGGIGVERPH